MCRVMVSAIPVRLLLGLIASGLVALLASPAAAITVDNFEEGAFDLIATSLAQVSDTQSGLSTGNVIGGERQVFLGGATPTLPATATLTLSPGDDAVVLSREGLDANIRFTYSGLPSVDLTDGGASDRFVVEFPEAIPGIVQLQVNDESGGTDVRLFPLSQAGAFEIPFTDLPGADPSRATYVSLRVAGNSGGVYRIADFSTAGPPPPVPTLPIWGRTLVAALLLAIATGLILRAAGTRT